MDRILKKEELSHMLHDWFEQEDGDADARENILVSHSLLLDRVRVLEEAVKFLADGYREIISGSHEAAKADHYVQFAKDTLYEYGLSRTKPAALAAPEPNLATTN